jgi:hypothetical protein
MLEGKADLALSVVAVAQVAAVLVETEVAVAAMSVVVAVPDDPHQ